MSGEKHEKHEKHQKHQKHERHEKHRRMKEQLSGALVSRREFILRSAIAASGAALGATSLLPHGESGAQQRQESKKTRVVVVTCKSVIEPNAPVNEDALREMLRRGICTLAGKSDVVQAWKTFIKPTDEVALADAGTWLLNVPEVLVEVMKGIVLASPKSVKLTYCVLDERFPNFLGKLREGLKRANIPETVMDGSIYTMRSKFHLHPFSSLVMTPTLKSHTVSGVAGVVKHYATMCKEGPEPHHPNGMETAGEVIKPQFGGMSHLIIVDALRWGETTLGPKFWRKSLVFGTDPVATDAVALSLFLENCKTHGNIDPWHHIRTADQKYGAGISDLNRIDVRRLTV